MKKSLYFGLTALIAVFAFPQSWVHSLQIKSLELVSQIENEFKPTPKALLASSTNCSLGARQLREDFVLKSIKSQIGVLKFTDLNQLLSETEKRALPIDSECAHARDLFEQLSLQDQDRFMGVKFVVDFAQYSIDQTKTELSATALAYYWRDYSETLNEEQKQRIIKSLEQDFLPRSQLQSQRSEALRKNFEKISSLKESKKVREYVNSILELSAEVRDDVIAFSGKIKSDALTRDAENLPERSLASTSP